MLSVFRGDEMEAYIKIILEVGFPIFACLMLGFFIYQLYKDSKKREKDLREEIKTCQENNTKFAEVLSKYDAKLEKISSTVEEIQQDIIVLTDRLE